jgi:glutamyl-tRNA synthetase
VDTGKAFVCYRRPEELEALREARRAAGNSTALKPSDLHLPEDEVARREAAGEPYVIRMLVPEEVRQLPYQDLLRGDIDSTGAWSMRRSCSSPTACRPITWPTSSMIT